MVEEEGLSWPRGLVVSIRWTASETVGPHVRGPVLEAAGQGQDSKEKDTIEGGDGEEEGGAATDRRQLEWGRQSHSICWTALQGH